MALARAGYSVVETTAHQQLLNRYFEEVRLLLGGAWPLQVFGWIALPILPFPFPLPPHKPPRPVQIKAVPRNSKLLHLAIRFSCRESEVCFFTGNGRFSIEQQHS